MRLWLLDADVTIDFLSIDVLDKLVRNHKIYSASSVINEVKFFRKGKTKTEIDFRKQYVESGLVEELSSSSLDQLISNLPPIFLDTLHPGELESLGILLEQKELIFCCCDAATIRALPFLDLSERGICAEELLKSSGLLKPGLKTRHTKSYFKENLEIGKRDKIYNLKLK